MKIYCKHLLSPLHFTYQGKRYRVENQLSLFVHSFIVGLFSFGIGGIFFFYFKSAEIKKFQTKKIKKLENPSKLSYLKQFKRFSHSLSEVPRLTLKQIEEEFYQVAKLTSTEAIQSTLKPSPEIVHGSAGQDRFSDNLPWKKTNVVLPIESFLSNSYINASWIRTYGNRKIIAAQAPTPKTALSFWHMVYECDVSNMIMTTSELPPRGYRYWPHEKEEKHFFPYKITHTQEHCMRLPGGFRLVKRVFDIFRVNKPTKKISHYQLPDWQDFDILKEPSAIVKAIKIIQKKSSPLKPNLVHCTAGLGRTGTWIAAEILLGMPLKTVNIAKTIANLRLQRPSLVQTKEQYSYLFDILATKDAAIDTFPRADICINPTKTLHFRDLEENHLHILKSLTDECGEPIPLDLKDLFLNIYCFYENKRFLKIFDLKDLYLPASFFKNLKSEEFTLCFKGNPLCLNINQKSNIFEFETCSFLDAIERAIAFYQRQIKCPYYNYKLGKKGILFNFLHDTNGVQIYKARRQKLRPLDCPEHIEPSIKQLEGLLTIEVLLPSIPFEDIDIIVNDNYLIIYGKMKNSSIRISNETDCDFSFNLQDEYYCGFDWQKYIECEYESFLKKIASATYTFEDDKFRISIDLV